jgi:hypothetical protein
MSRALFAFGLIFLVACAGGDGGADDDGGDDDAVDAAPRPDADEGDDDGDGDGPADAGTPDAEPEPDGGPVSGEGGLGQTCNQTTPCPADAPICTIASASATTGMCTALCAEDYAFTTDAAGNVPLPPAGSNAACAAIFEGTAGTAACATFLTTSFQPPLTGPRPAASTAYTADVMCGIRCGTGNACPSGLRCTNQFCQP